MPQKLNFGWENGKKWCFFWTVAQLRESNGVFFGKIFSVNFSRFLMFFCGFFEVFCQISKKSMFRSFFDIFTDHKKWLSWPNYIIGVRREKTWFLIFWEFSRQKLIFLRFFLFFSKNHCSSKLFYYKHFASLYTLVSQTYDLKTNFLLVHHRRHFLIAKSEKKKFFLSNFLIFFQKLAKKSLFNWRQFLYTSKTLDELVLMQKFSSICSRGLEVMKFWLW